MFFLRASVLIAIACSLQPAACVAQDQDLKAWWKFDEGSGTVAIDSVTGRGDKLVSPRWRPGVSGSALAMDGVTTHVFRTAELAPKLTGPFTLEAWVALQGYPWNWCPIVSQEWDRERGYSFGIDAEGHVGLQLWVEGWWRTARSEAVIPIRKWVHLAAAYDRNNGLLVYINGKEAARNRVVGALKFADDMDFIIGRNRQKVAPTGRFFFRDESHLPAGYSLEGALDELKIYSRTLSPDEIQQHASNRLANEMALPRLKFPSGPEGPGNFGAFYTRLKYEDGWDALWRMGPYADVVVRFDQSPIRLVFWRGTSFVPAWVTENGLWYNDEWLETARHNVVGCAEPISDKQARYSHVRILESNDARAVIHWRYALNDIKYQIARVDPHSEWGDWGDEYYTIYPDGVAVRKIVLWSSAPTESHEFQESIILNQPEAKPSDSIEARAVTLANMKGETTTYSWLPEPPEDLDKPAGANIQLLNFKSRFKPFLVVPPKDVRITGYHGNVTKESLLPWWNHWPVTHIPSDGRTTKTSDRPSHSSITHVFWDAYETTGNSMTKIMLHGLTDKKAEELVTLAKSWVHPPPLKIMSGGVKSEGYDPAQRAYVLSSNAGTPAGRAVEFELQASHESPLVNPVFVLNGWGNDGVAVKIRSKLASQGKDLRVGRVSRLEGTDLVVWLQLESVSPVTISLSSSAEAYNR